MGLLILTDGDMFRLVADRAHPPTLSNLDGSRSGPDLTLG
jgi:hypothetical protein